MSRWPAVAAVLAAAGFADSAYLTALHYDQRVPLYCTGGVFHCSQVLTSSSSAVAGVPVAAAGLVWFAGMLLLALRALGPAPAWLRAAVLAWSAAGVAAVLLLIYTELFVVGALCLWCSVAHLLVLVLFAGNLVHWWAA